jgi:pSer/pThr/pTyr-binding forkhead associated (FHA) protein
MILDAKAWIVDLGSANGTLVDGAMVRRERLREGSEIVLGSLRLVVRTARVDDEPLPSTLMADWCLAEIGPTLSRSERLRRVAGAQTCAWADGGHPMLQWPDNGRWEELGPVRRQLVEALTGES